MPLAVNAAGVDNSGQQYRSRQARASSATCSRWAGKDFASKGFCFENDGPHSSRRLNVASPPCCIWLGPRRNYGVRGLGRPAGQKIIVLDTPEATRPDPFKKKCAGYPPKGCTSYRRPSRHRRKPWVWLNWWGDPWLRRCLAVLVRTLAILRPDSDSSRKISPGVLF